MKKIITLIFSLVIIISSNSFAQLSKPFELMNESERAAAKLEMIKNKPNPKQAGINPAWFQVEPNASYIPKGRQNNHTTKKRAVWRV